MPLLNEVGGYISDPYMYAQNLYTDSAWKNIGWQNNWESHINLAVAQTFPNYPNCCVPLAITNIIKMYGNKYNNSSIKLSSNIQTFNKVMNVNNNTYNPYYINPIGVPQSRWKDVWEFVAKSFKAFGVSVDMYGPYTPTFDDIKNVTTGNRLMLLYLEGHAAYGTHAVVGYAYSQLRSTNTTDWTGAFLEMRFLKICDGITNAGGRFLNIDSIDTDEYWEVYFD